MKPSDEYKVCSLEEAEEFAKKRMENAYELADELLAGGEWSMRAQAMLRYQADQIKELTDTIKGEKQMDIKVKIIRENKDGSANAQVDFDKEGLEFLVQEGLLSIITQFIKNNENAQKGMAMRKRIVTKEKKSAIKKSK
jgi:hypothetical protein